MTQWRLHPRAVLAWTAVAVALLGTPAVPAAGGAQQLDAPSDENGDDAGDSAAAAAVAVEATVRYQTSEGIYIDVGSSGGLAVGQVGWIELGRDVAGQDRVAVEVVTVASDSAFLRSTGERFRNVAVGERITIVVDGIKVTPPTASRSTTLIDRNGTERDDGFVPLLVPPAMQQGVASDTRDIISGRITFRQLFQVTQEGDLDFHRTQIRTRGKWDRLDGTPWSLEWSGDLHYRGGDALAGTSGYQELRPEVYHLSLSRRFDDESTLRVGRFIPTALPSVGYLDGVVGEKILDDHWRVGVAGGLKPRRGRLEFSVDEPTVAPYVSYAAGAPGVDYYTGTAGFLASVFDGHMDRMALLVDQRLDSGPWTLYSSSEVDFDSGKNDTRKIVEITRLNLNTTYRDGPWTWRGGVDRFELTDSDAERDDVPALVLQEDAYFDQGYWRGWIGAAQRLSDKYEIDEEVSYTNSDDGSDALRWALGLTRRGLPGMPSGTARLQLYNLEGTDLQGYGGRVSAFLPYASGEIALQPSVSFRVAEFDLDSDDFFFADVGLRGHWLPAQPWSFSGGVSYGFTEDDGRLLIDVALTYRW
ncbi:MAG: hypothetical protein AAF581_00635 [Planctomycetota bacterium]